MLTSIIIPQYGNWQLTHQRLHELYNHVPPENVEIVLVDDCSPDQSYMGGLAWWQKKLNFHTIRYKRNKENLGFGQTCNAGADIAKGDVLVFLSTDVIVRSDFVQEILEKIQQDENILIGGRVIYFDTGWNTFPFDGKMTTIPYCEGWLLSCTRRVWDDLGGFDPIYSPYDFEDIDTSLTALSKGYRLVSLERSDLHHISGATIANVNPDRQAITVRNRQRFYEKWKEEVPKIFERLENLHGERE